MSDNEANPYAPPATVDDPISDRPRSTGVVVCVSLAALCYVGFTIFLLGSAGNDHRAGKIFLFNVPVLLFWLLAVVRLRHFALLAGLGTAVVQTVILLHMCFAGFEPVEMVVAINGGIIAVLLVLVWLSQRSTRK